MLFTTQLKSGCERDTLILQTLLEAKGRYSFGDAYHFKRDGALKKFFCVWRANVQSMKSKDTYENVWIWGRKNVLHIAYFL